MSYDPIAGNAAFSRVRDIAGQVATVTAGRVNASSVSANNLNAKTVTVDGNIKVSSIVAEKIISSDLLMIAPSFAIAPYGKILFRVELRTHTTWTGVAGTVIALTTNGNNIYRVPAGGIKLVSASLIGASDLIASPDTVVNVGSSNVPGSANNMFDLAHGDDFELGGSISVGKDFSTLAFGSTGSPTGLQLTANDFITLNTEGDDFHQVGGGATLRLIYYT